jgi:hypothetical protein
MTPTSDPDNLRTRIAKVLYRCDWELRDWEKATYGAKQPYYADADAVIRELGLRPQKGSFNDDGYHGGGPNYPIIMRRYVTNWEKTDE